METAKADIVSRELIKPSSPTPNERKQLKQSLLDQFAPELYIRLVFFYQNQSPTYPSDPSQNTLHLKKSLSECLTKFYPLAGKLSEDHLSIDCDDSGALFVEAKVDAPLFQAVHSAPYESFRQYLPFDPFPPEMFPRNEILLAVQINWFECGGSAIGVCISHKVADFASLVTFMNSWAAINRGESIKFLPDFDIGRNLFPPRDVPFKLPPSELKGKLVGKRFLFTKEKLMELKDLAISSSSVKDPSRVEVVTAFLVNQLIKVARSKKNSDQGEATKIKFLQSVNLRSKISSLKQASKKNEFQFGNVVAVAIASFSTPDDNETQEGFRDDHYCDLVSLARSSIRKVDDDYVWNFLVPFMNNMGTGSTSGTNQQQQQPEMMMPFTSWCRSSTYEADFGWGKPLSVVPAGDPSIPTTMLTSTENEDVIEARIAMLEDEFALFSDELLSLELTGLHF
ncbi:OLC1v1031719C1 [Oldenlandia corymbosa var. corymbosa]|uniref:OLC1v1031719C1 n=1 Tax=Oldenlandia corymbosa var. corymbosa TaxID=529605 RepID=A0AAV1CKY7_OLDCO|nr:OLC1v1031719C1 [Oldenlandia corymbosa var. corymbosa]